jgi:hypothetical protein
MQPMGYETRDDIALLVPPDEHRDFDSQGRNPCDTMLEVSPRRIALLAALTAGLVGAGVGCSDRDVQDHEMHRRHRVQLDLPPVEAALWFAARYPQYFTSGEKGLGPWLDGLDPRDRDFVIAMGQTLAWAWVEHELAGFEQDEPDGLARQAEAAIRRETLNQLDLNPEQFPDVDVMEFNAWLGDPDFAAGVFARLVRGVSNCEGQNHLVGLLLDTALESKGIDAVMISTNRGHELVQLDGPTLPQPIYVDAWSNLPAFTLEPSRDGGIPSLDELGDPPPEVVPGAAGRRPFSAAVYAAGIEDPIEMLVEHDAPTKPVDLVIQAPPLDEAKLATIEDPWRLYLFARILHLYDDPRADGLYKLLLEQHCSHRPRVRSFVCAAASALHGRLAHWEP